YRKMINDKFAAGFDYTWATYDKYYPTTSFVDGTRTITTDYFNYVYSYGLTLSGQYFLPVNKEDRKSTRLNSSHVKISYAVFCLNIQPPPTSTLLPYTTLFRSYRKMINDKFAAGFDYTWATYDKYYPTTSFVDGTRTITTDYFNYVYSYGLTLSGQYFLPVNK